MKRTKKSPKYYQLKTLVRSKYLLIAAAVLLVLSGSAFAYHTTHNSSSLQQQSTSTDNNPLRVNDTPSNLKIVNGADEANSDTPPTSDNTPQPTPTTPRQGSTSPTPSKAGCTYADIPYSTTQQPDPQLAQGKTRSVGGTNGSKKVCTDAQGNVSSETVISSPVNRTDYYGTYTSDQAYSDSRYACKQKGYNEESTQFGDCVASEMHKRSFYYQNGQWVAS